MKDFITKLKSLLSRCALSIKTLDGRVIVEIAVGAFAVVSCSLYFSSCSTLLDAEKMHFNGCVGKGCVIRPVVHLSDSIRVR